MCATSKDDRFLTEVELEEGLKELLMQLGANIRKIRMAKGLTLYQAVSFVEEGITESYLGCIERGEQNTSLKQLLQISYMLQVPLEGLFSGIKLLEKGVKAGQTEWQPV